jgi:purine operon repressor
VEKLKAELDPAEPWTVCLRDTGLERLQKTPRTTQLLFRMTACDLLRLAKQHMTYFELRSLLGKHVPQIARWTKGRVLPGLDVAVNIWRKLDPMYGLKSVLMELDVKPGGVVDTSSVLGDPSVLRMVAADCVARYAGYRVTKVLTVACNSTPLATTISTTLMVPMVVAKNHMDVGVGEFWEVVRGAVGERLDLLYIPRDSIGKSDSVLIVEDVVRTGRTVNALMELVDHAKAEVAGVYCLVAFKQGLERLKERSLRVEAAMEVVG